MVLPVTRRREDASSGLRHSADEVVLSEINLKSKSARGLPVGLSGMLRCQGGHQMGDGVIDVHVRVVVGVTGLLWAGLTACSSPQTETAPVTSQVPSPAASTGTRSLTPEGPVATITPTPPEPASSPTASPSEAATEEPDTDSRTVVSPKPNKSKKPKPASQEPASKCDPNYAGACVPIVSWDLDCADIGASVTVVGSDIHRFDADGDGAGCESY